MSRRVFKVGDNVVLNNGDIVKIEGLTKTDAMVCFVDYGYSVRACRQALVKGAIRNRLKRETFGVGYLGLGPYKMVENRKYTKHGSVWRGMIKRCYSPVVWRTHPLYKECSVDEVWHDFQNFSEWYHTYPYKEDDWHLDKDLLVRGNKVYSPSTCSLIPQEINGFIMQQKSLRSNTPIGVSYHSRDKVYNARMRDSSKKLIHLGYFDCPAEAFNAYKSAKEQDAKDLADKWKDKITKDVYEALYNFTVDIGD